MLGSGTPLLLGQPFQAMAAGPHHEFKLDIAQLEGA
jgi:hypothetical protein